MCPAYVFLNTFIESLLTFRYLWFGVHFVYEVRECSNLILVFFLLISLAQSFIVSLINTYCQHQGRNIPFSPCLLHQLVFVKFLTTAFWALWGDSFLRFRFAFLIFSRTDLFSCDFFSRVSSCYLSNALLATAWWGQSTVSLVVLFFPALGDVCLSRSFHWRVRWASRAGQREQQQVCGVGLAVLSCDQWGHSPQGHPILSPPSLFRQWPQGLDILCPFWGQGRTEQDQRK